MVIEGSTERENDESSPEDITKGPGGRGNNEGSKERTRKIDNNERQKQERMKKVIESIK